MISSPDFAPEANRPQASLEGDLHRARPERVPAQGQRVPAQGQRVPAQGRRVKGRGVDLPGSDRPTGPTGYRPAGRHVRYTEPAATDPPSAGPLAAGATHTAPMDTKPPYAGVTEARLTDAGVTDAGVTDAGVTDAGVTEARLTEAGATKNDAGLFEDELTDAESAGRHRLPVSSVQPAAAALVSGLIYVLTAGKAGSPDARRTLGRPRFLRRGGAA
ncbi:hypothetical protein [Actinopolymorpha sp. B9G3]|uniref:hypothetical protein n=1 Tax=Actinopolymorpha sp. B9G3 TaxID=3158970 RepID=UPI0032D8F7C1